MNHQQTLETLLNIERCVDVNTFWIGGVQIWPLLRRDIWMYLLSYDTNPKASPRSPIKVPYKIINDTKSAGSQKDENGEEFTLDFPDKLIPADILFWSRKEDHTEIFADGAVDRIIDPVLWDTKKEGFLTLKVSRGDGVRWDDIEQMEPSIKVTLDQLRLAQPINWLHGSVNELFTICKKIIPSLPITYSQIVSAVNRLNSRADFFDNLLDIVKPRLVMLSVFYTPEAMALTHACRRRGLPVVDIQHGKQGLYHAMYSGWSVLPVENYSVLPDVFWTWGDESVKNIRTNMPKGSSYPRQVVGGNRWLAMWKEGVRFNCTASVNALFKRMSTFHQRILITLQPLTDPLPSFLVEAIKQAPRNWFWLVRTHPHQRKHITQIDARFKEIGVQTYDVMCASVAPLYSLLSRIDIHVTCWSSVAYEALVLDKPTVLVDPAAHKLYADYIEQGIFSYADTADSLLQVMIGLPDKPVSEEESLYIETSNDQAHRALDYCLNISEDIALVSAKFKVKQLMARLECRKAEAKELTEQLESSEAKAKRSEAEAKRLAAQLESSEAEVKRSKAEVKRLVALLECHEENLKQLINSTSWRITAPMRKLGRAFPWLTRNVRHFLKHY